MAEPIKQEYSKANQNLELASDNGNITRQIINELVNRQYDDLPDDIRALAKHCFLDWLGVTIAGAKDPGPEALFAELIEAGGVPEVMVFGRPERLPALPAALINGTASHALDYDDVNFAMSAHPSVVIFPALIALAEKIGASGQDVISSFVAGYEAAARVGVLVAPAHYDSGFHGTATIGTFAATAACAHLMKLSADQTEYAFGIAATQAAGIRSMFGTDCKPLHAGKASYNGLLAARLAMRGFNSKQGALECDLGFAQTHSDNFEPERALATPPGGYFLRQNLFKYHAACYMTHSTADSIADAMKKDNLADHDVKTVEIMLDPTLDTVCNIQKPATGLEMKFSTRAVAALTLIGENTAKMSTFDDHLPADPNFINALNKVNVRLDKQMPPTLTKVELTLVNGKKLYAEHDSGIPDTDIAHQEKRLVQKFISLTDDLVGPSNQLAVEQILDMEQLDNFRGLFNNVRVGSC